MPLATPRNSTNSTMLTPGRRDGWLALESVGGSSRVGLSCNLSSSISYFICQGLVTHPFQFSVPNKGLGRTSVSLRNTERRPYCVVHNAFSWERTGLNDPFKQERVNEARLSLPSVSQHVHLTEPRAFHPAGVRERTASPSVWPALGDLIGVPNHCFCCCSGSLLLFSSTCRRINKYPRFLRISFRSPMTGVQKNCSYNQDAPHQFD